MYVCMYIPTRILCILIFSLTGHSTHSLNNKFVASTMIKIKLTAEDVGGKRYYLDLKKAAVEEHIVKLWSPTVVKRATIDDIEVLLRDLDTSSKHNVNFRYYKHRDSYFLQGLWRKNFIKRRSLKAGDEIGIGCDLVSIFIHPIVLCHLVSLYKILCTDSLYLYHYSSFTKLCFCVFWLYHYSPSKHLCFCVLKRAGN